MRALMGELGGFSFCVSEFIRVSSDVLPPKAFPKHVPEVANNCLTPTGLPVQVQILGGDPERMALSALNALKAGATAIDINFGCPAKTVNRHDGGASILRSPCRIREIVSAVRQAVPTEIPVSAKLRLGWDSTETAEENAQMAAEGGATWITIHARTRMQGYLPPVFYAPLGRIRKNLDVPLVANGDIWNLDEFRRCQDETGCKHFMLGRCAMANPRLPRLIAAELGLPTKCVESENDWPDLMRRLERWTAFYSDFPSRSMVLRFKQWLKLAANFGDFVHFDAVKLSDTVEEFYRNLEHATSSQSLSRQYSAV